MRIFILILAVNLFLSTFGYANSLAQDYPRVEERKVAMDLLDRIKSENENLRIEGLTKRSPEERAFLIYFRDVIYPYIFNRQKLYSIGAIYSVSTDRALYNDNAEKEQWQTGLQNTQIAMSELESSKSWKHQIRYWANLAIGLNGELPNLARKMIALDQLKGVTSEMMPLMKKLAELQTKISSYSNESTVTGADLGKYQKETEEIEKAYRSGLINFNEATQKLDSIFKYGFHAKGHDVSTRGYETFNEMAIVRTKIANMKGFDNWAQYQLSTYKFTYAQGLQTPEDHIDFMSKVLADTLPAARSYIDKLHADHPTLNIDSRNSFLLSPETDTLISEYFPVEKANEFWTQAMLESGFSANVFSFISLDSFPRANKQTHAYMENTVNPLPRNLTIKSGELNIHIPRATSTWETNSSWLPPMINIVQNARNDGIDSYSTVFHEGGHALDFAHRLAPYQQDEAYAYSETASMTMERFFDDEEFIKQKGTNRQGFKISTEAAHTYLKNKRMMDALGTRGQVFNALFDVLIWNTAYTESSPKFVDRVRDIYDEVQAQYFTTKNVFPSGVRGGSRMFNTSHFYSGDVRYQGYVYADMAAQMTANFLWDQLESNTGRRTFLNQKSIAKLLREGHYQRGFSVKFPKATEKMTGNKFKPNELSQNITKAIKKGLAAQAHSMPCVSLLK